MPVVGQERTFRLIDRLRAQANWNGRDVQTARANPPPGWVIAETEVHVHSSSNGSRSVSTLASDSWALSLNEIKMHYDDKIEAAASDGKQSVVVMLRRAKDEHVAMFHAHYTSHNLVEATVTARGAGTFFDQKRGWDEISVDAKCIYLGIPS